MADKIRRGSLELVVSGSIPEPPKKQVSRGFSINNGLKVATWIVAGVGACAILFMAGQYLGQQTNPLETNPQEDPRGGVIEAVYPTDSTCRVGYDDGTTSNGIYHPDNHSCEILEYGTYFLDSNRFIPKRK